MKRQNYLAASAIALPSRSNYNHHRPIAGNPSTQSQPPGLSTIRQQDIKADIYTMASDHFRGRSAGTPDELKAAVWLADKARAAGLAPGGEDGTYFQFFSMWRNRISSFSTVSIGDHPLPLWTDVLIPQTAAATVNAPILFIDKADTATADVKGKAIALLASTDGFDLQVSLPLRRYPSMLARKYAAGLLTSRGAAAVIFIADDLCSNPAGRSMQPISITVPMPSTETRQHRSPQKAPVLLLHASALHLVKSPGQTLKDQSGRSSISNTLP